MPVETVVFNWVQPYSTAEDCELLLGGLGVAAIMRWAEDGIQVVTAYNQWLLKQVGKFRITIEVRNTRTNSVELVYRAGFRKGGRLQLVQDKKTLVWKVNSTKEYELVDGQGGIWAKLYLEVLPKTKTGSLETTQEHIDEPEFEVLMVLGWYLCVTQLGFKGSYSDQLLDGTPGNGGSYTK